MKRRFKSSGAVLVCVFAHIFPSSSLRAEEQTLEVIGDTHAFAAFGSFSGPGAAVPSLANSYDMTLFEMSWGGKQTLFNGSGITTNANYPLTTGDAFTNNTHIGLSQKWGNGLSVGLLAELYTLVGDRVVGRVFGDELPWNDFPRENGAVEPAHFHADLYNGFLEGQGENARFRLIGGTLASRDYPELSVKETNEVRLGSLIYRLPVSNGSFFSKDERRLVEGRHPLRGVDFIGDVEYADKKHFHLELFGGAMEPMPLSDLERDSYGGRASADVGLFNAGFSLVYSDGLRPTTGIGENELVWAVDSSFKLGENIVPYFTFARTDYERENTGESPSGNAYVAGVGLKNIFGNELKTQYQRVEENYELMAYHKIEHYPTNFEGVNTQVTITAGEGLKLSGVLYHLWQIDTAVTASDALFGDSYFPSLAASDRGTIDAARLGAQCRPTAPLSLFGYVEHAKFRKNAEPLSSAVDKDVYNFYGAATLNFTKELYVEGAFRRVFSVGSWQTMNFRSHQDLPEASIGYKIDKDRRALLIYQYYGFEDNNDASLGRNDYYGHQVVLEIRAPL